MKTVMVQRCDATNTHLQQTIRRVRNGNILPHAAEYRLVVNVISELITSRKNVDDATFLRIADALPIGGYRIEQPFEMYDRGVNACDMCAYRLRLWSSDRVMDLAITPIRMRMAMRQLGLLYGEVVRVPAGVNGMVMDICEMLKS